MRSPVSVKPVFSFPIRRFFRSSRAASVAIYPSALCFERYSLGASWELLSRGTICPEIVLAGSRYFKSEKPIYSSSGNTGRTSESTEAVSSRSLMYKSVPFGRGTLKVVSGKPAGTEIA
jgi:hypothetical protein